MCNLWAFFHFIYTLSATPQSKLKSGKQAKIQPIFRLYILPSCIHSYIFFVFSKQISALYELLILFGMHLKCLWINVLLMVGWWKFYLRIHAIQIETSTLMILMLNLFQQFSYITQWRCIVSVCVCECVSNWFTIILLWIWPTKCGPKLECFHNIYKNNKNNNIPIKLSFQFATNSRLYYGAHASVFYWSSFQQERNKLWQQHEVH